MTLELKLLIGLALVAGLLGLFGWQQHELDAQKVVAAAAIEGRATDRAAAAAAIVQQQVEADAKTEMQKENAHVLALANAVQNSSIDTRLAADLVRLRARTPVASASGANMPEVAGSAASDGSVGGLPDRDRDLLGVGARANKLRAKLAECQAWIADQVKAMP